MSGGELMLAFLSAIGMGSPTYLTRA